MSKVWRTYGDSYIAIKITKVYEREFLCFVWVRFFFFYELFSISSSSFWIMRFQMSLSRISLFNICRKLMSCDAVFHLEFVSRKSISRAQIIEVGMMGGISFEEIRWQYPGYVSWTIQRCCGFHYTQSQFSFYRKRVMIFPSNHFLWFQGSCAVILN